MRSPAPLVGLLLSLSACTSAVGDASLTTTEPDAAPTPIPVLAPADERISLDPTSVPQDARIELTRTSFSTLYRVQLGADGTVTYDGETEVETQGRRTGSITVDVFADAWRDLVALDRDHRDLLESCYARLDDGEAYIIVLRSGEDWIGLSGQLDGACADNEAHAALTEQFLALIEAADVRTWTGDEI